MDRQDTTFAASLMKDDRGTAHTGYGVIVALFFLGAVIAFAAMGFNIFDGYATVLRAISG